MISSVGFTHDPFALSLAMLLHSKAKRRLPPSVRGAADNPPEEFIANVVQDWKSPEGGKWIEVSVDRDANITVTNGRTNASKTYKK